MTATPDCIELNVASARGPGERHARLVLYLLWGFVCISMIGVAVMDYFRDGGHRWWEPVVWEGSSMLFVTGLLVVQQRLGMRYSAYIGEPARWFAHHLKWLPLAMGLFVVLVYATRHLVYSLLGDTYRHPSWAFVLPYEALKVSLFVCPWLGVIYSFESFARMQEERQRTLITQRFLSEARLSQLSAQLRPHFFFNVLNTISTLMHLDVVRADRLLARLGDLLRGTLESTAQDLVPLRQEVRLLELYAQIMLERFEDRATLHWHVDEGALAGTVPSFLLQPLLENAFKHGIERTRNPVRVEVAARREAERLVMIVSNTGSGLPTEVREGIGLRNCRERLQMIYGETAVFSLSAGDGMVSAYVSLPWRERA
jgi:signal transduction histidine kinase